MAVIQLTCISCPLGCPLTVETDGAGQAVSVTGNTCKRGEVYGRKEVTAPPALSPPLSGWRGAPCR